MFRPLVGTPAAKKKPKTKSTWCKGFIVTNYEDALSKSQRAASAARKQFHQRFGGYVRRNCAENH